MSETRETPNWADAIVSTIYANSREIDRLRVENERLRAALSALIERAETVVPEYDSTPGAWDSDIADARAALNAKET